MTCHFRFLTEDERTRLFVTPPQPFGAHDDLETLGVALGATLYSPATRPALAEDVRRGAARGVTSTVICLEDAVSDHDLAAAERNAVGQLDELASADPSELPMLFVRVREPRQVAMLMDDLGDSAGALSGFVMPKFDAVGGRDFLDAVVSASEHAGRRLLAMPVLESRDIAHAETRLETLLAARDLLAGYRDHVPAVRVGATDLSSAFGLRRAREFTVWDVRLVADALVDVVNVFARVSDPYVVTGPVWEYFPSGEERIFRSQLRLTPFAAHEERALRAKLLADDLDGLIREVELDRANGMTGKTVIHPSHVAAVHALSVVSQEEYADACDVLAADGGGVTASSFGNKMNEGKPHAAWARRTLVRARVFGVVREGVSFVDLLGAVLHP